MLAQRLLDAGFSFAMSSSSSSVSKLLKPSSRPLKTAPSLRNTEASSSENSSSNSTDWSVYCLISSDLTKTYVGVTSDLSRRVRQHNGEISGGAKASRSGRPWKVICSIHGFATHSEACQLEWSWKDISKRTTLKPHFDLSDKAPSLKDSPVVIKRQIALQRLQKSNKWHHLDIKWDLNNEDG